MRPGRNDGLPRFETRFVGQRACARPNRARRRADLREPLSLSRSILLVLIGLSALHTAFAATATMPKYADVPQLMALVAPRGLSIAGARAPDGSLASASALQEAWQPAVQAFALHGAGSRLSLVGKVDRADPGAWFRKLE
jgi:hypothetical protein